MTRARYLIRFDDICPTMNWSIWDRIEPMLFSLGIKPIMAVVPDNKDNNLKVMSPRQNFWERVRYWQKNEWCIALHGYEHRYESRDSGLIGINENSEFSGLPPDVQEKKLRAALRIFADNGVIADAWVAPSHSFDRNTVEALVRNELRLISDGYYFRPVLDLDAIWIPQQLWKFRRMPLGIWTVCYHSNLFTEADLLHLEEDLRNFQKFIIDVNNLMRIRQAKRITFVDKIFHRAWLNAIRIKRYF